MFLNRIEILFLLILSIELIHLSINPFSVVLKLLYCNSYLTYLMFLFLSSLSYF